MTSISKAWTSVAVALVCLRGLESAPAYAQDRLSDRILTEVGRDDPGFFVSAKPDTERMRSLLTLIARSARVPIGFEEVAGVPLPFDGDLTKIPLSARAYLTGLTVGEAMNALVSADPRYSWREEDGLILIRPVQAWRDPAHFLHHEFGRFRLVDGTVSDVARAIYERLGVPILSGEGGSIGDQPDPDTSLARRMVFEIPPGSVLHALNAVVRIHGGLGWMVHYSRAPADVRTSCIRFVAFSGRFFGSGAVACETIAGIARAGAGQHAPSNLRMHHGAGES